MKNQRKNGVSHRKPPVFQTMEIKDVAYKDAETNVSYLTDEAVEGGRDWVSFLKL